MEQKSDDKFLKDLNDNAGIVHRICNIYFRDPDEREDAFQEIVYQLWKSYSNFQGASKFSTWMYRVALNTAITHIRKKSRSIKKERLDEKSVEIPASENQEEGEERMQLLYEAINELSPVDKAIVLLHLEENSYEEIASVTGLTITNVGVRLVRIKQKLEERLKNKLN